MILLVVGLAAVIVVILIAVFLSIRLGRSDEHDDEVDIRSGGRDQRAEEDRWREPGRRARERGHDDARRGYDDRPRRPSRSDSPAYQGSSARRRATVPASAGGRERYDGGPSRRAGGGDYPAADHPSLDFPTEEYTAAGYPAVHHSAEDFPPANYPSPDPAEYPADDFPSGELPALPARPATRSGAKPRQDAGRTDPRRTAAPEPAPARSRSRQHRGKRDTDDWPSSEWDKLSDEQYWAELSADKPLATMARPAQPASNASATAEERQGGSPGPASPERAHGRDQHARRERPPQRGAATERLPVRSRQQPPAPAAGRPVPAGTHPSLDTGPYPVRDAGRHPSLDTALPIPDARRRRSPDTGARAGQDPSLGMLTRLAGTPVAPVPGALEDDPLTSPSFSLGAEPVTDSRSYGHARKAPQPAASASHGPVPLARDPLTSNRTGHAGRHDSGSYPATAYSSTPRAYPAEPAPATAATEWYGPPSTQPAPAPAYGNPYSYPRASPAVPPAVPEGGGSPGGYLADPVRTYSPPSYQPPVAGSRPSPSGPSYPAPPALGRPTPGMSPASGPAYPEAYPGHPYGPGQGYPGPAPYPSASGGAGYAPGDDRAHGGDPYPAGEYGGYPPQG